MKGYPVPKVSDGLLTWSEELENILGVSCGNCKIKVILPREKNMSVEMQHAKKRMYNNFLSKHCNCVKDDVFSAVTVQVLLPSGGV